MQRITKQSSEQMKINYQPAHAVGYLLKKMPQTYMANLRVFHQISQRIPDFHPTSFLDFGAGLGSSLWAGIDQFKTLKRVAAVEPNVNMRKLGKFLMKEVNPQVLWTESLSMIPGIGAKGKFDIVSLSEVLQEVSTPRARQLIIQTLWSRVQENGYFVIIQPGSPKGFRFIHDIRQWALQKFSRAQANIVAPCPHSKRCPLADQPRKWCHFSQLLNRFPKEVFPKKQGARQFQNQKFSFIVLKKGETPNIRFQAERDAPTPGQKSFFWSRIIYPVIKKQQHSIFDLCTSQGKFQRNTVAKSHGQFGGYRTIRKSKWGDLWYIKKRIPNKFRKQSKSGVRLW